MLARSLRSVFRPLVRRPRFFGAAADADDPRQAPRDQMEYDVVVVGAGPAGLATAIKLRQLCAKSGKDLKVCVVEKGAEVGAHILSGNVFDPRSLNELIPDWKAKEVPNYIGVARRLRLLITATWHRLRSRLRSSTINSCT